MKKILVTGGDGFIGSHLVEYLLSKGHQVRALAQYNSFNSWGWLDEIPANEKLTVETGDIRDPKVCDELCRGMDWVFHLAALIAIPYSYKAPHSYVDTNISGTANMCEAAMKAGVQKFIHTSTSEVYGTALYTPIDEKHPMQPQSPYSASKIGADNMALSYFYSFNLPVVVARPFNTYGPRQSARAVIPTIITQILSGAKEIRLGDTSPVRDFNFVADTCAGMVSLAEMSDGKGEVYNIGSGKGVTIGETFQIIKELIKSDAKLVSDSQRMRPANSEVFKLIAATDKLKSAAGYIPKTDLRAGLSKTIEWFSQSNRLSKYKTHIYNV